MRKYGRERLAVLVLTVLAGMTGMMGGCGFGSAAADTPAQEGNDRSDTMTGANDNGDEAGNGQTVRGAAADRADGQTAGGGLQGAAESEVRASGEGDGAGIGTETSNDKETVTGTGDASGGGRMDSENGADCAAAVTDFSVRLLQYCSEAADGLPPYASMPMDVYLQTGSGRNILLSPLSVMTALTMTAGGAQGETRAQMEEALGLAVPELARYLSAYQIGAKFSMANGIWFTEDERFTVDQSFLQENEQRFGAGIYRVPFNDSALQEINGWVREKTDGMIEEIIDEITPDAVMYLVNALAFDAQWQEKYHDGQVREGTFTKADGTVQDVELMYSTESRYLKDAHAEGFLKEYAEGRYAFAALLPEEGMTVQEYISSLDGTILHEILAKTEDVQVEAAIPKYEGEYSIEMSRVLQDMGMEDAFDSVRADFSGIGYSERGNIYIGRVLHKNFIAVDEEGTKAGAATAVEMQDRCAVLVSPDTRIVYLNRPFVYMILDMETGIPVFMGVVEEAGSL